MPFAIAVVDDDRDSRTELADSLDELGAVSAFSSLSELERGLPTGTPVVLVAGPSLAGSDGFDGISALVRSRPLTAVVLVTEAVSTSLLRKAMRSGINDVIDVDDGVEHLVEAIRRAGELLPSSSGSPPSGDGQGRVITVFSPKGGTGKSMLVCNLAVTLAKRGPGPVVLIDADLQFGDVAVMLKMTPAHTIVDVVNSLDRLDAQAFRTLLTRHESSGVLVLPAPMEPAFADQVRSGEMQRIVQLAQECGSHVLVDTPTNFGDVVLGLLEQSGDIVLVAGMDVPSIKNMKIGLNTLRLLNLPASKLHLVLNRAGSKVRLEVSDVERTLQLKAEVLVPSDILVPQTVNKGVPAVLEAPKSQVARSIERLADLFPAART